MTTRHFGEPVKRVEDPRLVTGKGRYVDDIGDANTLHVAFVRSPHARARIVDIDPVDAYDVEGVYAVYTYEDLDGAMADPLPLLIPHPDLTHPRHPYALAKDRVSHVGEPVAMVVAADRYVAEDAVNAIRVEYEVLTPVIGLDGAVAADELVHEDVPGNVAAVSTQAYGDAEAQIDAAPHTLELTWDIERSAAMPMEGKGVHARWDAEEERLTLFSSTQTSTGVRGAVSAKLGLDISQVDVITPDVGGGFGVKIMHPWPEELLIPWAARRLGRHVKWTEDRREHFVSSAHERAQRLTVQVGFDDEGRMLGLAVDILHDHGAYIPYGLIVPINSSTQLLGPYKPDGYRVTFTSLYTNTVIVTPYRGAGRPQGVFAMERTMDRIAQYLGKDRMEVREANFLQPKDFPVEFGNLMFQDGRPLRYDSGDYPGLARKLRDLVGWEDFAEYRAKAEAEGRKVGIGVGFYVEGTGPGPYEGAHIEILTSGKVKVATGLTSQGQGHQTILAQIVADELGVPLEDIEVTTGDTRRLGYSVGTFASRGAVMSGSATALAARKVRERITQVAADALEADPGDLEIVDGQVRVKGDPSTAVALGTIAVLSNPLRYAFDEASKAATQFAGGTDFSKPPVAPGQSPGLDETDYYSPTHSTFAAGAHAVIVETDPETADIRILKYAVVHDCGPMINPRIVEGQIHGGVAQGVGGALYERMAYEPSGQLANASYMDFLMPYVSELPTRIDVDHLETPSPLNPLGIKGAGEAGVIPTSAAIAAAIEDAEGIPITSMPISPSELYALRLGATGADPLQNTMPGITARPWSDTSEAKETA